MLTAVVLTKNEEKNIGDCLKSLKFCDEIIVVDDYSEDKTVERIRNSKPETQKLKIFQRHLNGDFAAQRNYGLKQAKNEWVLFVDADERISPQLAKEIVSRVSCLVSRVSGYFFKRKDFFLGHELKHGETASVRLLRLARKNCGKWEGKVHEVWKVQGEISCLKNPILHYHSGLTKFLKGLNCFSTLAAQEFCKQEKRDSFWEWLKPAVKFVQNYFLRLGFLDGTAGFVHAVCMSLHSFLVRAKLFMLWKNR